MDQKLISNPVFQGLQVPTLEEEPRAKSTILYANKYSGISEVELTDPELLSVIESTVGISGNNVLVQLKNKMTTFRNGPWYIDSENGVIHIHNRKHPKDSVYQYIYQYENGEVLTASFRMIEVSSPISGIGGFVSAVSKSIGILQAQIGKQNIPEQPDLPTRKQRDAEFNRRFGISLEQKPFSTYVATNRAIWEQEANLQNKHREDKKESERHYRTYKSMSQAERVAHNNKQFNSSYDAISSEDMWKFLNQDPNVGGNPQIASALQLYQERCRIYGQNSDMARAAREDVLRQARAAKLNITSGDYWSEFTVTLTTNIIRSEISPVYGKQYPSPADQQRAVDARVRKFVASSKIKKISNTVTSNWRLQDMGQGRETHAFSRDTFYGKWKVTFQLTFYGYGSIKRSMNGERFIRGILDRYDGMYSSSGKIRGGGGGNLVGMINKAASNIGRGKKEKKLQATIRVIGNPVLETGQQIDIQNVGKKHSGVWYIHKVSHSIEFGQGYVTDMQLSRQAPKPTVVSNYNEVHTQSSTVDNGTTNTHSVRRSGRGTTGSHPRGKANVVKGNSEHSYQDAANVPFTFEEEMYARTIANDPEALAAFTYRVADKNAYNAAHGTKHTVVTSSYNSSNGSYSYHLSPNRYTSEDVHRTKIKSSQYDIIRSTANRRRGGK